MNKNWFFSKTKGKVILLFFQNPHQEYHLRLVSRLLDEHVNAVREALLYFEKIGVLFSTKKGKRLFFQANHQYPFYDELLRMTNKQIGLGARLLKEKMKLGKIEQIFLAESFFQHLPKKSEEVVLLIVGLVSLPEIEKLIKEEGEKISEEINYALLTPDEYAVAKKNKDPFLTAFLQKNRLVLVGKQV